MKRQIQDWDLRIDLSDLELMLDYMRKLGGYGLGLFDVMDLGLPRDLYETHLNEAIDNLRSMAGGESPAIVLRPKGASDQALVEAPSNLWNFAQTLRFAAATTFLTQYYKHWMYPGVIHRAVTAKVLYRCQTGILDDVVDKGSYSYLEAKQLYDMVFSSMIDTDFDEKRLVQKLVPNLNQDQVDIVELIIKITSWFNTLFLAAPRGTDYVYHIDLFNARHGLSQALSMYTKEEHYDLEKAKRIAKDFPAPASDIQWHDRLANGLAAGTQHNLIDMSFCQRRFKLNKLKDLFKAWWYLDAVAVYLNTSITIYDDLRDGIVNVALIASRENELRSLESIRGYDPALTEEDYDKTFRWIAEMAGRGLKILSRSMPDPGRYFPFMVVMMPFMLMAETIGKGDRAIRNYLEYLRPPVRAIVDEYESRAKQRVRFPMRGRIST
jgi:hypothetical protein